MNDESNVELIKQRDANIVLNQNEFSKSLTTANGNGTDFKLKDPADFIAKLNNHSITLDELSDALNNLFLILKNSDASWVEDFQKNALRSLLCIFNKFYHKTDIDTRMGAQIHLHCLQCIKTLIMTANCNYSRLLISGDTKIITALIKSLDYSFPKILTEVLNILIMIAVNPNGHKLILHVFKTLNVSDKEHDSHGFQIITDLLKVIDNDDLAISCLTFINTLINSPLELNLRMSLRNEFMNAGLRDILEEVNKGSIKYSSKEVYAQFKLFHHYREKDCDKNFQKFDCLRFQFDDLDECCELVKNSVIGTDCEPLLKSILQHLLFIRDDPIVRAAYYRLIEECVSQIVIHHSGCDPDFRPSQKVIIYTHPQIGNVPNNRDDTESDRLKEILLSKDIYENKIASLESELEKYKKEKRDFLNANLPNEKEIHNVENIKPKTIPANRKLLSSLKTPKFYKRINAAPSSQENKLRTNTNLSRIPTYKKEVSSINGNITSKVSEERKNNTRNMLVKVDIEKGKEDKRNKSTLLKFERDGHPTRQSLGFYRERIATSKQGTERNATRSLKPS